MIYKKKRKKKGLGFGSRTICSTHPASEIASPGEFIVNILPCTHSELYQHSPRAAPALPVSCTRTLRELYPSPPTFLPSSCPCTLASLFLGVIMLDPPSCRSGFAPSLNVCTLGNTLSPMLQPAGTTLHSKRKLFHRPRSISRFCSSPLEAA